jgi:hypothetical protein
MMSGGDLNNSAGIEGADGTPIGNIADALKTAEAELATFTAHTDNAVIALNKSMMSIVNTTGSTVVVRLRQVWVVNTRTTATTGVVADFRLLRCVGHSAGTLITTGQHDTVDTQNASVTVRTGATVTSEGTAVLKRLVWSSDEWGAGTLDTEAHQVALQQIAPGYWQAPKTKPITLRANQGITLKQVTNSANGFFDVAMVFTQETA